MGNEANPQIQSFKYLQKKEMLPEIAMSALGVSGAIFAIMEGAEAFLNKKNPLHIKKIHCGAIIAGGLVASAMSYFEVKKHNSFVEYLENEEAKKKDLLNHHSK